MRVRAADSVRTRTAACAAGLFLVNLYVCRELFWTEYLNQMGSIEGAFIGLARYVMRNAADLTWYPLWYNGIPYQDSYPPLLHWTVALIATVFHWSPAHAYHFTTAFCYCIGPVTLFLLCVALSGSRVYSFFIALIYSLISPSAFLIADFRQDIGLRPRRLQALLVWGEGPHAMGLALLPLAMLWLHRAITRRRPIDCVVCAVFFAATPLTNWLAVLALFAAALAYLCSTNLRVGLLALPIAALAYGMAVPWIPPSTIQTIRINAPYFGNYGAVYSEMPRNLAIIGLLGVVIVIAIRRTTDSLALRFSVVFTYLIAALVLPAFWWKLYVLPQPDRYRLELELALAMLIVFAAKPVLERTPSRLCFAIALVAIVIAVIPAKSARRFARYFMSPVKIDQTIEYKTAIWLDRNISPRRVFTAGSTQFWLNAFSDTPQLGGGFGNGIVNQMTRTATYIIPSGDGAGDRDAEIAILWLKAMGVHAVAVAGPNTTQAYRDFRNPRKFDGVLQKLWQEGDDSIYAVPQRSDSLARIVTRPDLARRKPVNGIDVEPLVPYVAALDNPALPQADFHWTTHHSASIRATLSPQHVVSIQIGYHPGWHAQVNGANTPIAEDGIGQMYVEPDCNGACSIELSYDGGREMRVAKAVALVAWVLALVLIAADLRDRKTVSRVTGT